MLGYEVARIASSEKDGSIRRSFWNATRALSRSPRRKYSGTKGRKRRPAFDRMLKAAVHRKFDMIAAWSADRYRTSSPFWAN